jgi:hypothetical protein
MKKMLSMAAAAFLTASLFVSCATINSGAAISSQAPIGSKVGEAKSTIYLGLWSSQGENNDLQKAAKNGGITKISHVEYIDKSIFLGLVIEHITRVYGD